MDHKLHKIYRSHELPQFVGLRRTQISELIKLREFPKPIKLSERGQVVGWLEADLIAWQISRIAARNAAE